MSDTSMTIGLMGRKIGMTRLMTDDGSAIAVSVLKVDDGQIVQRKTVAIDGYDAVQITTGKKENRKGELKTKQLSAALKGHYAKSKVAVGLGLWEFRGGVPADAKQVDLTMLSLGCFVNVQGTSKGKGFQGGVKRHNFRMQDATHGNSVSHRALGSTGQCQYPGRVFKGKKMAGQMGNVTVTEQNLEVMRVDVENKILLVKGAVPGAKTGFVRVCFSNKKQTVNKTVLDKAQAQKEQSENQEQSSESS